MKTTEIGSDIVTYYFKDEQGNTISQTLAGEDKAYIERQIDKGIDKGKFSVGSSITLYWSVEF